MLRKFIKTNFLNSSSIKKFSVILKNKVFNKKVNIFTLSSVNKPLFHISKQEFSQQSDSFKEYIKNYEENKMKANSIIKKLMVDLNEKLIENEEELFRRLQEVNEIPISLNEYPDFRVKILQNVPKIPIKNQKSLNIMFNLLEKLDVDEYSDKCLDNLSNRVIEDLKNMDSETISIIVYTYSKSRIKNENLWQHFENAVLKDLDSFTLRNLTQVLISFTMTLHRSPEFYKKVMKQIEKKIPILTPSDNARICFSLTRGIVPLREVSEATYKILQDNFASNTKEFNLFQISKILLLISETQVYNNNVFTNAELEITKEYLNQIDEILKDNKDGSNNLKAFLDDLTTAVLSFSIKKKGSKFLWSSYLKNIMKMKDYISIETLENLLFIAVQVAEMHNIYDIRNDVDLYNIIEMIQQRIFKENLLKDNKINPFNLMMTLSTLRIENNELWGDLIESVLKAVKHENFKVNAFIISDITYAFGTYETSLLNNSKPHELYEKNRDELWNYCEKNFNLIKPENFDVLQIANIAWYFSQIDFGNKETWNYIIQLAFMHINNFDQYNYLLLCMAFSTKEIENADLWKKLEEKGLSLIDNFNIEDIRKLIFSFIKNRDCVKIWGKIGEVLSSDRILQQFNLENMFDLQLPLAVVEIKYKKIWIKFEELVFKNMSIFENDNDALMNTVYSFSKSQQGSPLLWKKFTEIVRKRLDTYDAEDLGHIVVCMNYFIDDKVFWDKFLVAVSNRLPSAKINGCNNLLKGITSNKYMKDNVTVINKVESKIQELLKEIKK